MENFESMSSRRGGETGRRLRWLGWFLLANALAAAMVGLRYFEWMPLPETFAGWAYLLLTLPGHYWLLTGLAGVALLPVLLVPLSGLRNLFAALLASAGLTLLFIDSMVFDQYRFHISAFVIDLLLNDPNGEIISFHWTVWLTVLGALAALVLIEWLLARWLQWRVARGAMRRSAGWHVALFVMLLGSHLLHVWADAQFIRDVTQQPRFYPLMQAATAQRFMERHGWLDTAARDRQGMLNRAGGAKDILYPRQPLQCHRLDRPYNLLMIVIDSWRADSLSAEATPNLHVFAERRGLRFPQHFSGSNSTRGGIFSLLYGLPATYWSAFQDSMVPSQLITTLQAHDYALGIFASAQLSKPEFDRTAFASVADLRLRSEGDTPSERDRDLTEDWLAWLDQQQEGGEQPFFGFLFYDSPHGYTYPEDYPEQFTPVWETVNYLQLNAEFDPYPFFNRYLNAVHYTDSLIGQVLDNLEQRGLLETTVVIVTGDHGQEFNDLGQNFWGHNSNFARYQLQVPLVIAAPGVAPGEYPGRTSHYDVVPTILENWLRCTNPPSDYSIGRNLLAETPVDNAWHIAASYLEYAFIQQDRILTVGHAGTYTLYDENYVEVPEQEVPGWSLPMINVLTQFYRR